ncbi:MULTISPECIES: hypothetical protein [unclassified Microcoleus]
MYEAVADVKYIFVTIEKVEALWRFQPTSSTIGGEGENGRGGEWE